MHSWKEVETCGAEKHLSLDVFVTLNLTECYFSHIDFAMILNIAGFNNPVYDRYQKDFEQVLDKQDGYREQYQSA